MNEFPLMRCSTSANELCAYLVRNGYTRCPCHFTVCVSAVFLMAYRLSALINYKNHKWAQNNRQCDNERTSYVGNTREKRDTHTKKHHSHNEWIEEEKKIDRMLNKNYIEKIQNRKRKIRSRKATTRHTHTQIEWVKNGRDCAILLTDRLMWASAYHSYRSPRKNKTEKCTWYFCFQLIGPRLAKPIKMSGRERERERDIERGRE